MKVKIIHGRVAMTQSNKLSSGLKNIQRSLRVELMTLWQLARRRLCTFRNVLEQRNKVPLIGKMINLSDPTSTDAMCNFCDFLWFDMEHTPFSPEVLRTHIMVAKGRNTISVVRIPAPNYNVSNTASIHGTLIKHILDANADGIILPQIRNAKDVVPFILDCKYPNGTDNGYRRGFCPQIPLNYGQISMDEYVEMANAKTMIGVVVETKDAVNDIENICSLEELDFIVIGTMDLSGSYGIPYSVNIKSQVVADAVDEIIRCATNHGKYVMYSPVNHRNLDFTTELVSKGVELVLTGSDVMAMVEYQSNLCHSIRERVDVGTSKSF